MLALITNDGGISSEGLRVLAVAAERAGMDVLVVAPSGDSSDTSASLASIEHDGRLLIDEVELAGVRGRCCSVEAAPAFIVRAALGGAFDARPDVVLSGVNHGANTGQAVLHSGTVGAASTAATSGAPGIAVSLDGTGGDGAHWSTVDAVVDAVLARADWAVHRRVVLNVNVPDIAVSALRGIELAQPAPFGAVRIDVTEVGPGYVSMQYSTPEQRAEVGTDVALLGEGFATLTALEPIGSATTTGLEVFTAPLPVPELR